MGPFKFLLELDAKIKGGARGMYDLLGRMNTRLKGIARPLLHSKRSLELLGGAAYGAGRLVGGSLRLMGVPFRKAGEIAKEALGQFAALASFHGLVGLARGAWNLTKSLIHAADSAARTNRTFEVLFGQETGAQLQKTIEKISRFSPFDADTLKSWVLNLKEAGFSGDRLVIALRAATDQAVRFGGKDTGGRLKAIGDAFESIAQKGELSEGALKKAGIQAPKFWEGVASRMGKTVKAVKALNQEGKIAQDILSAEMIDQIAAVTGGVIGPETAKAGRGVGPAFARAGRVGEEMLQSLAGSPALQKLAEQFDRFADTFSPDSPTGKRIREGLESTITSIAEIMSKVDYDKLATTLLDLFRKLPGLISATTEAGLKFLDFVSKIGGKKGDPQKPGAGPIGGALEPSKFPHMGSGSVRIAGSATPEQRREFEMRGSALDIAERKLKNWLRYGEWKDPMADGGRAGEAFSEGAARGIERGKPRVIGAAAGIGTAAIESTAAVTETHSPSRAFERLGLMGGEGYAQGIEKSQRRIGAAIDRAVDIAPLSTDPERVGGGGGTTTINVPITVEYSGNGSREELEELARRIRDVVPGAVASAFSKVRLAQGGLA